MNQLSDRKASSDRSDIQDEEPRRFTERGFSEYIVKLCNNGKHEIGERYYLSHINDLLASGVNPKEKINHLIYLSRLIQSGSGTKHGHQKLLRKARGVRQNFESYDSPPGGFVEFGCGAHDPIALSLLHYLNGWKPCHAIDLLKPRNDTYSAMSMYDIIANIRCFPQRYCFDGTNVTDLVHKISHFDLAAFEAGDFWGGFEGVQNDINYEPGDILESSIEDDSISRVVSFAVLEHVDDIDSICDKLHRVLLPGGIVSHFVDLVDHRVYRRDPQFNSFTFLTEEDAPKGMNRLRASEISESHERHGFEILRDKRQSQKIPEETKQQLLPRYRRMRLEDVSVIKQHLVVRRI